MPLLDQPSPQTTRQRVAPRARVWGRPCLAGLAIGWLVLAAGPSLPVRHLHAAGDELFDHVHLVLDGGHHSHDPHDHDHDAHDHDARDHDPHDAHDEHDPPSGQHGAKPARPICPGPSLPGELGHTHRPNENPSTATLLLLLPSAALDASPPRVLAQAWQAPLVFLSRLEVPDRDHALPSRPRGPPSSPST